MSHLRTQIRDAVANAITGLPLTGPNVFKRRSNPINPKELPALSVYTPSDVFDSDFAAMDCVNARTLTINIIGNVEGVDESVLDQLELEVNRALIADFETGLLSGLTDFIVNASTSITFDGEAGKEVGEILMEYEISYRTDRKDLDIET